MIRTILRHTLNVNYRLKIFLKIFLIILLRGLFVFPIVFWPWAPIPYEVPRVWFYQRWVELLAIVGFLNAWALQKRKVDTPLVIFVVGFIFVSVVASIVGVDLRKSIAGNFFRADGLVTLFHHAMLFFLLTLFFQKEWLKSIIKIVGAGAVGLSVWALGQFLVSGRIVAPFGNPNFMAGYLAVSFPFLLHQISESRYPWRLSWIIGMMLLTCSFVVTHSWGAVFTVALSLCLWFGWGKHSLRIASVVGISAVLLCAFIVFYKQMSSEFLAESRGRIFTRILLGVAKRPLLGWGWANVDYAFEAVPWPIYYQHDVYVDKAHSSILEIVATTGVVGLSIFGFIVIRVVLLCERALHRSNRFIAKHARLLITVLIVYLFHSQTNVTSIAEEFLFWMVLGIVGSREFAA